MQRHTYFKVILIVIMSLSACTKSIQPNNRFKTAKLGTNAVNERCELKKGSMLFDSVDMPGQLFNIYCGNWEWPSARIFKIDTTSFDVSSLDPRSVWQRTLDRRMSCVENSQNTQQLSLLNSNIIVMQCILNNGGWPYLALIIKHKDSTYMADGIPATLAIIQQAVATLTGVKTKPTATDSAAIEYLQQHYKDKLYSAADLQVYFRAITLGQYYNSIKSFSKAEAQYWLALKQQQKVLGTDNSGTSDALMHIALELSNQEQFTRADDLFTKVDDKFNMQQSPDDEARFSSYQALHYANQGDFNNALQMAEMVTKLRTKDATAIGITSTNNSNLIWDEGLQSAPAEVVQSLYIESAMLERLGKNDESKEKLEQAQYILSTTKETPPLWEPQIENLDGVIAASSDKQQTQAEKAQTKALDLFEDRAPSKRPTILSLIDLGKLYFNQKRNQDAIIKYRKAISLAKKRSNSFRLSQLDPYFKFQLDNSTDELKREMFEAAQLVQGSITAKEIAQTVARFTKKAQQHDSKKNLDPISELIGKLQKQEFKRAKKQQQYQVELGRVLEQGHLRRLEKLNTQLDNIDQQIEKINQQVQKVSPEYQQLINSAIDADDVINALSTDEALLQILVGEQQSYVFFIHNKNIAAYSVSVTASEITATVKLLRETIKKGDGSIFKAADKSYQLYNKLFGPIAAEIASASHLITVPSGPLLSFPFELFVTESTNKNNQYDDTELSNIAWLVKSTTISLIPSAQSFVYLRQHTNPSTADKSLIAFGDFVPFSSENVKKTQRSTSLCQLLGDQVYYSFSELAGTRQEIEKVAAKFASVSKDDLFLKSRFTENAVKSKNLNDYRIVYFATHALLPDQIDCKGQPSLITSINTTDNKSDDGFLTTGEISELNLNADLVVLSACNTGGAYQARGESLSGLARAFFFAGTRSLLVSHWSVHDTATAELMILVFDFLKNNPSISIAEALTMAQMEMLNNPQKKNWAHPYYWAGFSLVGDGKLSIAAESWSASR